MNSHATAWIHQTSSDPALSPAALAVAALMAKTITGAMPVAATTWRKAWQASGLPRGEVLDSVGELIRGGHLGQRRVGWNVTPGYQVRLHTKATVAA
jgi:hypothetical protein